MMSEDCSIVCIMHNLLLILYNRISELLGVPEMFLETIVRSGFYCYTDTLGLAPL